MRRLGQIPALDGLRGIAILLVVANHAGNLIPSLHGWQRGGALGVDLFFVLSGFLITSLLLGEWDRRGTVSLRAFYRRRARRLLPALILLVGLAWIFSIAVDPRRSPQASLLALARLSYFGNFLVAFGGGLGTGFEHLWSLAQEEQFYLLWPPLLVFLLRRRASPRQLLALLGGLIAVVNVERLVLVLHGASEQRLWYAPDTHADAILFGCVAGIIWTYRLARPPRWAATGALLSAAPILIGFRAYHPLDYPVAMPVFAAASSLFLLAVAEFPKGRSTRALSWSPLRRLGKVSYGLYLWHLTLIALFGIIGVPIALVAALLSYKYVEAPFRWPAETAAVPSSPVTRGNEPRRSDEAARPAIVET
jgi:peptidoglycan/LPS O-acetylase OafA/YrhL